MYRLMVTGRFAAAHSLRNFKGRCEALHGHNWKVEVVVQGNKLDKADLLMDFGELKKLMNQALDQLDHRHLNEVAPFDQVNPSSELIAKHLYETIAQDLPEQVSMHSVSAWESEDSRATYLGA
ncbi:MAG: 6-carboxytetrahydropterin synthase QueD [Desulfarculaceae bacterium]|nr:6-carboxytetrahydropterin synthase QueD [Desulfarculaceae bacterium]MCF8073106.1 6-carboxytetrahydropterin synthase QueD [Desulfarculaceae bacterium]MCF8101809.1 6-carboxytetrahydropterin synthase QueD [Desulfarculaceae bacterium]MCF8117373.1 6-carboxytetrahydropterin synthase QueD [Desulfarculaceae bacterium]